LLLEGVLNIRGFLEAQSNGGEEVKKLFSRSEIDNERGKNDSGSAAKRTKQ
jgi:hypothetical protein